MDLRALDPSSDDELDAALALFKKVYRTEMSKAFYRWRFLANPFGPPMVSLLWDGATLVGHYAVSPMKSLVGDRIVASAQSMTTMTHPDYRNRGVFSTLAEDLYARMAGLGVGMVWGFPNTQSHYGFVHRLGWRDIGLIATMTRGVDDCPEDAPRLVRLGVVDERISEIFSRSLDGRIFPSCRDAAYLRWRYLDHPVGGYTIFGLGDAPEAVAVVKSYQYSAAHKALEVVDVLYGDKPRLVGPLFAGLLVHARETGHALLRTWLGMADPAFSALEKLSFMPKEPIVYFGGRELGALSLPLDRFRLTDWVVSMGDSDNY
jgi:hypothetical protein